ncbi:MAG: Clp1/GlmU family protein [Candidatus Nezhaarchaeota archaeon]|nr:Clp1/GlmU family protein [Candidatus Nezhaarchaeota archaeon]
MELEAKAKDFYILEGPLKAKVLRGEAEVCGARLSEKEEFVVVAGRAVVLEALADLRLEVRAGEGSRVERSPPTIPSEWRGLVEELKGLRGPVMLVGGVDVGKTFLATYLANRLLQAGLKVAVVDSDVGQSSIGPPATIGAARLTKAYTCLLDVPMELGYFVGSTTPVGHLLPMVVGVKRLVDRMAPLVDVVLMDTTGMVHGGVARALKIYKADVVRPRLILLLERGEELRPLARQLKAMGLEVRSLPASPWVRPRDREDRRMLRELAFQIHFRRRGVVEATIELSKAPLIGSFLGTGRRLSAEEAEARLGLRPFYCEEHPEGLAVVVEDSRDLARLKEALGVVKASRRGFEDGLLIGLLGEDGLLLEVGVLRRLDLEHGVAKIATPLRDVSKVRALKLGSIRLGSNFEEVERLPPGVF